jgi:hypothetical protein
VRDEGRITGRVYEVNLVLAMLKMRERRVESYLARNRILFVIGRRGAFINLAPARRRTCHVQERTDELRFACVTVSDDGQVAYVIGWKSFHGSLG